MRTLLIIFLATVLNGCGSSKNQLLTEEAPVNIDIKSEITFQTIHNFGASDAWSCQYVGNWPEEQKNKVADLLFSMEENTNGSPKGIGF